jgi:hypothetical protein
MQPFGLTKIRKTNDNLSINRAFVGHCTTFRNTSLIKKYVIFKLSITEIYPRIPRELFMDPLESAEHTLWETLHWWELLAAFKNIWHTVIYLNCKGNLPTSLFLDTEAQLHHVKHGFGHTPILHNMASSSDYQWVNMCTLTVQ